MSRDIFTGGAVHENSDYLAAFERLAASGTLVLTGDNIYVERLGKIEQKTMSGIYIPTETGNSYKQQHKDDVLELGVVLMVGPGDIDSDGNRMAMEVAVGDVIELPVNVKWYSQFGHLKNYKINSVGRMRASQVMVKFTDYVKAMEALNGEEGSIQSGSDQPSRSRGDDLQGREL